MATVHLHLQNVPPEAGTADIRRLFHLFDIPNGGVQIVGGPKGEAFVTFSTYEDLLKATSLKQSYIMGRQLSINLVNGEEVERIIDNMKDELVVRIRPMDIMRTQGRSQSREPPTSWGLAAPREYTPATEFPSHSNDPWEKHRRDPAPNPLTEYSRSNVYAGGKPETMGHSSYQQHGEWYPSSREGSRRGLDDTQEKLRMEIEIEERIARELQDQVRRKKEMIEKRRLDATPLQEPGYSYSGVYAGGEPKRMRHDSYQPDEGSYYNSASTFNADGGSENLQMELEMELQRAQEIKDQLNRNKEKIQRLKQGIIKDDGIIQLSTNPVVGEAPTAQMAGSGSEWLKRQSQLQTQSTQQYQTEAVPPAAYQAYSTTPIADTRYQYQGQEAYDNYPCQPVQESYDRVQQPATYDSQGDWYNHEVANYTRSTPYYEDQRYSGRNDGYNQGGTMYPGPSPHGDQTDAGHTRGYGYKDPWYHEPSPKEQSPHTDPEYVRQNKKKSGNPFGPGRKTWKPKLIPQLAELRNQHKKSTLHPDHPKRPNVTLRPRSKECSSPYSGSIKQALYFISLKEAAATASSVWAQCGGSSGRSVGVLLLDSDGWKKPEAFVAYENYYDRNSEISLREGASDWTDRSVYRRLSNIPFPYKLYKTTPTGEDVEVSDDEKALFAQDFLLKSSLTYAANKTEKERESEQPILNEISRSLFDITSTEANERLIIPDSEENKLDGGECQPCYLRLDGLPPGITAREVWDWFGAATGPCSRVTLTLTKQAPKTKVAFVSFRDQSCKLEAYKYNQSKTMTQKEAFDEMADKSIIVVETTDGILHEKGLKPPSGNHILKIEDPDWTGSVCKMWLEWFGGAQGPVQSVTVMETGRTRTAFIKFCDPLTCQTEKAKHVFSEIISETEMLKLLAICPYDKYIKTSNLRGDRMMSKKDRAKLKARFPPTKMQTYAKEKVSTSRLTPVGNQQKQTGWEGQHDSEDQQSDDNSKKEDRKSTYTSEENITSTISVLEENTDRKTTEDHPATISDEKQRKTSDEASTGNAAITASILGENSDREETVEKEAYIYISDEEDDERSDHPSKGNSPCTVSKPEETTQGDDVTEPIGSTETKFTEPIGSTETKFTEPIGSTETKFTEPIGSTETKFTEPVRSTKTKFTEPIGSTETKFTEPIGSTETKFFLQIPGITKHITACKVWDWFGGPEGLVTRVTLVPKAGDWSGQAYVEFKDQDARDEALKQYQSSKVMTEQEVLCILAAHACRTLTDIFESSVSGEDRILTTEEREIIRNKVYSVDIPKGNVNEKYAEGKGSTTSAEEGKDTTAHTPVVKEQSELKDPEPTGDIEEVENTDTKFFLQIPNLNKAVTASRVWSWFGGARGPLPGVTLVQQAYGRNKDAYVEFSDRAARNAVKLAYKDAVDLNEKAMLHILAAACKSNAGIFQSSERGGDRLLTMIERDLIKKQAFQDKIQSATPPGVSVGTHSVEEKIDEKARQEGHLSSSSGLARQVTGENVAKYSELNDVNQVPNSHLPSQSQKPKLLQQFDYEHLHLTDLKPEVTAYMLSLQYRPCCGVTLIKNPLGQSVAAYIAFERKANPKANVWQRTRDRELADLELHYEIYEDTGRLGDRLITLEERNELIEHVKHSSRLTW